MDSISTSNPQHLTRKHPDCHGFAEEAEIHTFRVFTQVLGYMVDDMILG